jgi:integrase
MHSRSRGPIRLAALYSSTALAAGLGATDGRLSMHSLRHSWASALATGGLPATTLARLAGHADAGFTLRVYASDPRDDAAVAESVLALAAEAGFGG